MANDYFYKTGSSSDPDVIKGYEVSDESIADYIVTLLPGPAFIEGYGPAKPWRENNGNGAVKVFVV